MHPSKERTLVIIKPDGVQRSLIGEVVSRYEKIGLKMVGAKMLLPTEELVEKHYLLDPEWKKNVGQKAIANYEKKGETPPSTDPVEVGDRIIQKLKKYITSGPVVAMVWEGAHAVEIVRKVTGGTEPLSSDVGTIRGDYVVDSYGMSDADGRAIRNIIHASGSVDEANGEIDLWFNKGELMNYKIVQEKILYDVDLNGILE